MAFGLKAKESKPEPTAKMELVKVASLNTIDSNKEFQRNVQLVQQQRALAAELLSKMDTIQDEEEHNKLQTELDALQQKLNENNELMFKTYGFSLNRNYVLTVEKSHIHMWVTEEESQKISEANKKAFKLLERVGIDDQANKYPSELSGGQQQRAAISRALALEPKLMLFDEPTSALDPEMISEVLKVMRDLADNGMSMLVVTHEMGFARDVADEVVFMDEGKIIERSSSKSFFENPRSERAKEFINKVLLKI